MHIIKEFKEFISRGNVIDMAVGVIVGSAFTAIVNSLVSDVFSPVIGLLTGGMDFSSLYIPLGTGENAPKLNYGAFLSAIINFLLIAVVVFLFVKFVNRLRRKKPEAPPEPTEQTCPYCKSKIAIDAVRCPHCTSMLSSDHEPAEEA